jgi:hypothetical protein
VGTGSLCYLRGTFASLRDQPAASSWIIEGEDPSTGHEAAPSSEDGPHRRSEGLTIQPPNQSLGKVQNEADLAAKDRPRLKRIDTSERLRIGTNSSGSSPNTKRSRSPSPLMLDRGKPAADSPARMDRPPSAMSIQELCRVQAQTPTAASFKDTSKRGELSPPSTANADEPEDFIVSSIIPNFLYLGPDPCTAADVQELEDLGIRQILNMALEIDDRLGLADRFDKYHKIPMRDFVEEKGVQGRIDEACSILGGWLSPCEI